MAHRNTNIHIVEFFPLVAWVHHFFEKVICILILILDYTPGLCVAGRWCKAQQFQRLCVWPGCFCVQDFTEVPQEEQLTPIVSL